MWENSRKGLHITSLKPILFVRGLPNLHMEEKSMKHTGKKILALTLALMMLFALAAVAAPADTGITVVLDGKALAFTDAAPQLQDGRTFVPFRTVFEAMGAQVTFESATRTVTAQRSGVTVQFVIGSSDVQVTKDGKTETVKTDAAPYIDAASGRTLIPVRFAAQSLGSIVGWDQATKTVNIVDSDKLKAAYADRFQLMDRYTKEANQLRGDSMAFSGKLNLGVKVTSEGKVVPISLTGTVDGSMDPSAMNMQANLSMDLSQALADAQLTAEDKALLENLKDLEINYILNLNTGMVYFNCPTLAKLDASSSADAWYAVSMNALYQDLLHLDIDFTSLLQGKDTLTVSEALLKSAEVAKDRQDAYNEIVAMMNSCEAIIGDKAFTKNGSTYTSNFSLTQGQTTQTLQIVLTETSGKFTGMKVEFSAKDAANELTLKIGQDGKSDTLQFEMKADGLELTMDMSLAYTALTKAPVSAPAAGSTILDLLELLTPPAAPAA